MRDSNQSLWSTFLADSPMGLFTLKPGADSTTNDLSPAIAREKIN